MRDGGSYGMDWRADRVRGLKPPVKVAPDLDDIRISRICCDVSAFLRTLAEIKRLPCTEPEEE